MACRHRRCRLLSFVIADGSYLLSQSKAITMNTTRQAFVAFAVDLLATILKPDQLLAATQDEQCEYALRQAVEILNCVIDEDYDTPLRVALTITVD